MSEYMFQYAVLRYVHDIMTQEFLNVGVVVYSKEARYFKAQFSTKYARLSHAFLGINERHYRRTINWIRYQISSIHIGYLQPELGVELPDSIETALARVLPPDDSSLVFGGIGGGLAGSLDNTLDYLFFHLVERYTRRPASASRSDEQVWQVYSQELEKYSVTLHLAPVTIETPTYYYEFARAWKNDRWHPIEPVSFDLVDSKTILEKANRWIGRGVMLSDSSEIGSLYLLLGAPRRQALKSAYEDAIANMQAKIPLHLRLVEENRATEFSVELAQAIEAHQTTVVRTDSREDS